MQVAGLIFLVFDLHGSVLHFAESVDTFSNGFLGMQLIPLKHIFGQVPLSDRLLGDYHSRVFRIQYLLLLNSLPLQQRFDLGQQRRRIQVVLTSEQIYGPVILIQRILLLPQNIDTLPLDGTHVRAFAGVVSKTTS